MIADTQRFDLLTSDHEQFSILVSNNVCYELQVGDGSDLLSSYGLGSYGAGVYGLGLGGRFDVLVGDKPGV
jgi:hypothetical protein